ncbi:MAG: hypothetical protein COT74_03640 [Bdellovibrionales bacterium CG10_big_fil_rev_8_21_14_0_10_45_34]|nr:MAG: hypothetical protein COT74_03640 [Bdellovibrionales bacterium CG10_big_fil_rev_8_21_14_0_10_45_34]
MFLIDFDLLNFGFHFGSRPVKTIPSLQGLSLPKPTNCSRRIGHSACSVHLKVPHLAAVFLLAEYSSRLTFLLPKSRGCKQGPH